MRKSEKNLPVGAAIAAVLLSGVAVLTPAQAFADSPAPTPAPASPTAAGTVSETAAASPTPSPAPTDPSLPVPAAATSFSDEAAPTQAVLADVEAAAAFATVTELADAFASASGAASIVLSQTLTGTTSDPAVAARAGADITFDLAGHSLTLVRDDAQPALGVPTGATLTIIDSVGGGVLTVENSGTGAGIGGAGSDTATTERRLGTLFLSGVTVKATSSSGAAIGTGARGGLGGTITIADRSDVTAASSGAAGTGAAGIGGASQSGAVTVNIQSGSTVVASGSTNSAGIGNGPDVPRSDGVAEILIDPVPNSTGTETTVTATGGANGAGIGNGAGGGDWPVVVINGGVVRATGQGDGAGIGSGTSATAAITRVNGGRVFAIGGPTGVGLGNGGGVYQDGFALTIGKGAYVEPSAASGVAVVTAPDMGITHIDGTLTIPAGNSMTSADIDWILTGTLNVDGTLDNSLGRFTSTGTINVTGAWKNGVIFQNPGSVLDVTGAFDNDSGRIILNGGTVNGSSKITGHNTTVVLNGNGGTPPAQSSTPVYGASYASVFMPFPGDAVRPGYTFTGWFTAQTGGTRVVESTDLFGGGPKTIPLYAQWTANQAEAPGAGDGDGAAGGGGASGSDSGSGSGSGGTMQHGTRSSLAATGGSSAAPWALGGIALVAAGAAAAAIAAVRRRRAV